MVNRAWTCHLDFFVYFFVKFLGLWNTAEGTRARLVGGGPIVSLCTLSLGLQMLVVALILLFITTFHRKGN